MLRAIGITKATNFSTKHDANLGSFRKLSQDFFENIPQNQDYHNDQDRKERRDEDLAADIAIENACHKVAGKSCSGMERASVGFLGRISRAGVLT
ncbi:MAG: hypothetical protein AAF226_01645 [Verrucomicrobiota bacterium]